jgi:AcrR family transcriptional regulator
MDEKGTRRQIVDAAYEAVTVYGITRLSLADVAKRARLSRQTLYRYFPSKDSLLEAVVEREEERFRGRIRAAVADAAGPQEALEAAIVATLEGLRTHPLVERLLETEPETLVPYLTVGSFPGPTTDRHLGRLLHHLLPDLSEDDTRRTADLLGRLVSSYVLDPFDDPPEVFAAWFSRLVFTGVHPTPVG